MYKNFIVKLVSCFGLVCLFISMSYGAPQNQAKNRSMSFEETIELLRSISTAQTIIRDTENIGRFKAWIDRGLVNADGSLTKKGYDAVFNKGYALAMSEFDKEQSFDSMAKNIKAIGILLIVNVVVLVILAIIAIILTVVVIRDKKYTKINKKEDK